MESLDNNTFLQKIELQLSLILIMNIKYPIVVLSGLFIGYESVHIFGLILIKFYRYYLRKYDPRRFKMLTWKRNEDDVIFYSLLIDKLIENSWILSFWYNYIN